MRYIEQKISPWGLLCQHYSKELESVDREIEKLYTDNTDLTAGSSFNKREEDLKAHIESFVGDLLKTKEKKLARDKLAYDSNEAYKWVLGGEGGKKRKKSK